MLIRLHARNTLAGYAPGRPQQDCRRTIEETIAPSSPAGPVKTSRTE
jgi:hypothetical protein